jgi:hypothetical protein
MTHEMYEKENKEKKKEEEEEEKKREKKVTFPEVDKNGNLHLLSLKRTEDTRRVSLECASPSDQIKISNWVSKEFRKNGSFWEISSRYFFFRSM